MIALRRCGQRRHVEGGEQGTWNTFFARDHPDPLADGFGLLMVFDEMLLAPGESTALYAGDEEEMVTYVHRGAIAQADSAGKLGAIHAGEFQRASTGRRVRHKQTNASRSDQAHFFRICLRPSLAGLELAQEQKHFTAAQRRNLLCVVASPDGRKRSLLIHQDAFIYSSLLDPGNHLVHELQPGRSAWLHIVYGEATLNDVVLTTGDGVGVANEPSVSLTVQENTELLLVDLGPLPQVHLKTDIPVEPLDEKNRGRRGTRERRLCGRDGKGSYGTIQRRVGEENDVHPR